MPIPIIFIASALLTVLGFQGWVLMHLHGQQERMQRRIDELSARAAPAPEAVNGLSDELDTIRRLATTTLGIRLPGLSVEAPPVSPLAPNGSSLRIQNIG